MSGKKYIKNSDNEIVLGLIGPIGTNFDEIYQSIQSIASHFSYKTEILRLSDYFSKWDEIWKDVNSEEKLKPIIERKSETQKEKISKGNDITQSAPDALAKYLTRKISSLKKKVKDPTIFVIRSLKREKELEYLRKVYGRAFLTLGIFSNKETLISNIQKQDNIEKHDAEDLYEKDADQSEDYGQKLEKIFPEADYFIFDQGTEDYKYEIERFFKLIFNDQSICPNIDEAGMAYAAISALKSLDIDRQVGASILNERGDLISTGFNDVPQYGGGLYSNQSPIDHRDLGKRITPNERKIKKIIDSIYKELNLPSNATEDNKKKIIDIFKREGVIEFTRCVHAEQNAIDSAARIGHKIGHSILYTTTFPCHICMRCIIDSGIQKIIYLEPYPKSNALELNSDSVCLQHHHGEQTNKVLCKPFEGLNPYRYFDFFKMANRKDILENTQKSYQPRLQRDSRSEEEREKK